LGGEVFVRFPGELGEIRQFMDGITPNNWNIYTNEKGRYIHEIAGTLNVFLVLKDDTAEDDHLRAGGVLSSMSFVWVDGIVTAKIEVWICLHRDLHGLAGMSWKGTILHELAHVAVHRCVAFRKKAHKTEGDINHHDIEEGSHGRSFQRALTVMLNRAIAAFGKEVLGDGVLSELVGDLDYYDFVDPR
jgi:hypothetical protein